MGTENDLKLCTGETSHAATLQLSSVPESSRISSQLRPVVLNLGSPDIFGLQLPEILVSTASGESFWEF